MDYKQSLKLLNLNPNYTQQELKKSYRTLSKKYHPDAVGGSDDMFKFLTEAYNYLNGGSSHNSSTVTQSRPKTKSVYHGKTLFDYIVR